MGMLSGRRALIVGVASKLSIAYGIAEAMHREGAELAFTYQNEKLKNRVLGFAESWSTSSEFCFPCDVGSDDEIDAVFDGLANRWDGIDIVVHAVGFAPGDQLSGSFIDVTTREGFQIAHDISSYSLIALSKAAQPMLEGLVHAVAHETVVQGPLPEGSSTEVPASSAIELCAARQAPVGAFAPRSPGARAFKTLWTRIERALAK